MRHVYHLSPEVIERIKENAKVLAYNTATAVVMFVWLYVITVVL